MFSANAILGISEKVCDSESNTITTIYKVLVLVQILNLKVIIHYKVKNIKLRQEEGKLETFCR